MSVIIDALEAARREKSRRESQGVRPAGAPVLGPLRGRQKTSVNWPRLVIYSLSGILAISLIALAVMKSAAPSTLPTIPPLTSTIVTEALAADSLGRSVKTAPVARVAVAADSARTVASATMTPRTPPRVASPAAVAPRSDARRDTVTVLQGQTRAVATSAPIESPRTSGRLRIAVEQPRQPEAARLFAEAVAAQRGGDLPGARRLYDSVLTLTPNDADALNNLGVLLSAQREYSRALELLRRATVVAPRNAGVWNNIGTVFHEQSKNSEAIAAFRHALTIDPQHPGAKVGLAQQYLAISSLGQAKELLEEVVAAHPQLPEAHYTLGQVLELQGDRAGATRAYAAFIKVAPARLASHVDLVRRRIDALNRGS
jgi:Tfp pilus assembly protein PilF